MADIQTSSSDLLVPIGTQVITRVATKAVSAGETRPAGAVGEIASAPTDASHAYRVRFADGGEIALGRTELTILKHYQSAGLGERTGAEPDLEAYGAYVIYRCVVGSRAYGLATDASDVDRRGIYLPPAELHWSLYGVPEQIGERRRSEEVYWELQKFLALALKANPNVLECLYTPLVEHATPLAAELLRDARRFLSKLVYQTYNGYVLSQFKKLEHDLRTTGTIKWKHAMHLIRLLLAGITALREGYMPVRGRRTSRARCWRSARRMPWDEVNAWRLALHRELDAAFAMTRLPERPDYERANAFLIQARRSRI